MGNTKDIQRRIKSINNTKKITKAMEMVAASKMRRAVEAVLRTRPYADLSWRTILNLSKASGASEDGLHPLLTKRKKIKRVGVVLITSNRGLCGGFNSAIINNAHEAVKKTLASSEDKSSEVEFIIIGKKGAAVNKYYNYKLAAEFKKEDVISEVNEVLPISNMIIEDYLNNKYDKIILAYTDFVSSAKQVPRIKQILPVELDAHDKYLGEVEGKEDEDKKGNLAQSKSLDYTFEPSPEKVLNEMVPRLIEVQLFQALLESNASEHSARMTAMHQATDAANDMVSELTLTYNKARQASITAEIAEISAGANALAE